MPTTDSDSKIRYRFGPLEHRGLLAGWRGGQIATVGAGLLVGVIALRATGSLAGAVIAVVALASSLAVATWPIGGRTAEEWAPDAIRFAATATTRRRAGGASGAAVFGSLRLLRVAMEGRWAAADAAVVKDLSTRTYSTSFLARAPGFLLLGTEEKEHRISAWGGVLSSLAREGTAVHRLQWTCRSRPASRDLPLSAGVGGDGRSESGAPGVPPEAVRSYTALVEQESGRLQEREVLVSLSVSALSSARSIRASGGGDRGACTLVLREARALRRRLRDASIEAGQPLSPEAFEHQVRTTFSPGRLASPSTNTASKNALSTNTASTNTASTNAEESQRWPWPMGIGAEWRRVVVEDRWLATYWISEWPRTDVGPDFLAPLLLAEDVALGVSVVMQPVSPVDAARKLEQARTSDVADAELRRRGGFLATARRRREEQVLTRREVELADGHAPFRFTGYVTVSSGSAEDLDEACARTEQLAARCGLELRLCYGDQANAFAATLPLCRGLV